MVKKETIKNLIELSKIEIREKEQDALVHQLGSIFEYIGHIRDVHIEGTDASKKPVYNILREDQDPHPAGKYSEELMREVPSVKDGFVKVPKIL
jgi:aspartyl-tRNA(Asn)/glutamyl-tRNA(Gln) amidotransferase subunit C